MLRILCVGTCLAYFIATVSTAIPFKPYTSSGYGGFEEEFEGAVDYSPVRHHRFSLQQGEPLQKTGPDKRSSPYYSLISDAVRDADYQKDTFYFKPLDANTNLENGERKAAMDNTERAQYIEGRKIEAVRSVDNRPSSWWKTYLNRNKGGPIRNFFPSDDAMVDVEEATSPTKPFSSEVNHSKDYLIKTNNPYFNLIISKHTLAPSIAGKSSTIVKLPPEVNPEGKHWITDENVALIRDISRNDVNSASNDANRYRDSNGAQRKRNEESHSDKHFIQDDVIKFPEKDIISSVYNMIESANSFPKWEDDVSVSLDDAEVLPEAQRRYVDINNKNIFPKPEIGKWDLQSIHFTTVTVGTLMIFLILVVMVLALRVHCRNREKTAQEWIRHPVVQPATAASDAIQPNLKHILHPDHLHTEPIRIKAKGLLERRGSNTSLTIDLGSGSERADGLFSPSRECTPEDFLMTAGSRMSRRQLRNCLKDPRDLHAEFWQIPTNHPDKCGVPGAAAKNRYRTVLPNEDTRVVLHKAPPDSPESPASQYINANYIRGYEGEERAYVATQGPLAHTIEDMWLLVLQERSPAIVMITRLKEKGRVKCEPYIPSYAATYGSVHLTVKQVIQKNGYTIRQIYLKRGDEVHTTLHFWFTSWPDHKAPSSARHLLAMASEVETARMECRGPVVVHCSAGIGRTGCFIGVSIGRLQLLEEDCVDVLSIVCQMRLDRGGMVQTAEQYEFIHRALALYEASLPMTASAE